MHHFRLAIIFAFFTLVIFSAARAEQPDCSRGLGAKHWSCIAKGDFHLQLHGASYHFDRSRKWNERNVGIGLRYQINPDWAVQAGTYDNSFNRRTNYLAATWTPLHAGPVALGVFGGLVSGYKMPVAAGLAAHIQGDRLSFTLRGVPSGSWGSGFLAAEVGVRL